MIVYASQVSWQTWGSLKLVGHSPAFWTWDAGGMDGTPSGSGDLRSGLASVQAGDLCSGTVTAVTRSGELEVALDGVAGPPFGVVGPLDRGWPRPAEAEPVPGDRITAGVSLIQAQSLESRATGDASDRAPERAVVLGRVVRL